MSKKMAEGISGLVSDVKVGSGAFMKSEEEARALAQVLIDIAHGMGKDATALITDMNQPLGRAVGNSLEVIEAFEALKGNGPPDFLELCRELAAEMIVMGRAASDLERGRALYDELIGSGAALAKMRQIIGAQSGDPRVVDDYALLPGAAHQQAVTATVAGYVEKIDTEAVGRASMVLGAGRARLDSEIDHGVGLMVEARIGDKVSRDSTLVNLHFNDDARLEEAVALITRAFTIVPDRVGPPTLIKAVLR
jgi:thymidine phosphorylase